LTKDVKVDLEETLRNLSGKGKAKAPRGLERKKMWDEVKALRKEYVYSANSDLIFYTK
jgi:DNA polymerase alpha-associated DNA helicase A